MQNFNSSVFARRQEIGIGAAAAGLTLLLLLPYPYRDALLLVASALAVVFAFRYFSTVWLAFLAWLPLVRLSGELLQINGFTMSRILVVALSIVWLLQYRDGMILHALFKTNGLRFFGLFVLVNLVSALYIFSASAVLTTLTYLEPLLCFAITYVLVRQRQLTLMQIMVALLIGAAMVAVAGVYEFYAQQPIGVSLNPVYKEMLDTYMYGYDSNRFGLGGRISSLIAQPVYAGLYWVIILSIALYTFRASAHARWWQAASIAVAIFFIVLSGTRAGMAALAAAAAVWFWLGIRSARQRLLAVMMIGASLVLVALLLPGVRAYLGASFDLRVETIENRNVLWRIAVTSGLLQVFQEHWFLGYGPGLIQKQSAAGQFPRVDGRYPLGGLENQYATILADGGMVAGIAYLLFMLGVVQDCARLLREPAWRARGVLLSAMFAAYFIFAATAINISDISNLLLMTIYGALAAQYAAEAAAEAAAKFSAAQAQAAMSPSSTYA